MFFVISAFSNESRNIEKDVAVVLTRSDSIPLESIEEASDPYFEGYIQALVDMNYAEYQVTVLVKDKEVWLANLPVNQLIA
ncbi:MAG: hypothetical protein COT84_01530, partial [Chlamydiae bacterium CG10_big_fil_rev_8_21_14_0_10_35_9]